MLQECGKHVNITTLESLCNRIDHREASFK